jgi:hypothetical protein
MNTNDLFAFLKTSNSSAVQIITISEPRSTMTQLEKFHIVFKRVDGFSLVANATPTAHPPNYKLISM